MADSFEKRLARAGVHPLRSGKVRDLYLWGEELWLVASDRISAFDVILPTLIPGKGQLLTAISRNWFDKSSSICPNHVLGYEAPAEMDLPEFSGRLTRAKRCEIFQVECVARGYLAGSGWDEYQRCGTIGGFQVLAGLQESDPISPPVFTPARKNDHGHDENLSEREARELLGHSTYEKLRDLTLELYSWAADFTAARGIILADCKLEFGVDKTTGQIVLADEIFTPDSSRFWSADCYQPGRPQISFDKQFVRDYLRSLKDWDRLPPGPELPDLIVQQTVAKYQEALDRLR